MRSSSLSLCPPILATIFSLLLLGCGSSEPKVVIIPKTYDNMKTLGGAYVSATLKNGTPPQKLADLRPFVHPDIDLEEISKSENDFYDFVIVWGVDFQTAANPQGDYPIVIYEKEGKNGIRYVCQFNNVLELPEQEFKAAFFPPGHTP